MVKSFVFMAFSNEATGEKHHLEEQTHFCDDCDIPTFHSMGLDMQRCPKCGKLAPGHYPRLVTPYGIYISQPK